LKEEEEEAEGEEEAEPAALITFLLKIRLMTEVLLLSAMSGSASISLSVPLFPLLSLFFFGSVHFSDIAPLWNSFHSSQISKYISTKIPLIFLPRLYQ
jgi:hypothetical protein